MALSVISNFAASVAQRNLVRIDNEASASLAKLSSGSRVVSARDDAAALAIGSRIRAEVEALKQASVNAGQAVSLLQVAEGAMARVSDILVRMKTLAVQAGSGQLGSIERAALDTEFQALLSEIDRIAQDTEFNGNPLINGTTSTTTALNSQSTTKNLVEAADGFQSIVFDTDVGDASFAVSFDSSTSVLTLTNLTTGQSQGINIGATAIAQNETQEVRFDTLGVTVTLNAAFDKTVDIKPTGSVVSAGSGSIETSSITVTGADSSASVQNLSTVQADFDLTTASSSSVSLGGFTASGVDLSTTGTKTVVLSDGTSDFTVQFNVTSAFTGGSGDSLSLNFDDLGTLVFGQSNTATTTDFTFKVGTGTAAQDDLTVSVDSINVAALGLTGTSVSGSDSTNADAASTALSAAIDTVNSARANLGASQNKLDFASANLATSIENQEAARSQLLDLDIALEITNFTSKQILLQTGVSMLAQANQLPQNLLRLFQ